MHLIANVIKILQAKFHCNRLTTVQDIQDYAHLIFGTQCMLGLVKLCRVLVVHVSSC